MHALLLEIVALLVLSSPLPCVRVESPDPDPNRRMHELLIQSEDLRQIEYEIERLDEVEPPSDLTPEHVHGGVGK